jgi:hypothetical protein
VQVQLQPWDNHRLPMITMVPVGCNRVENFPLPGDAVAVLMSSVLCSLVCSCVCVFLCVCVLVYVCSCVCVC